MPCATVITVIAPANAPAEASGLRMVVEAKGRVGAQELVAEGWEAKREGDRGGEGEGGSGDGRRPVRPGTTHSEFPARGTY